MSKTTIGLALTSPNQPGSHYWLARTPGEKDDVATYEVPVVSVDLADALQGRYIHLQSGLKDKHDHSITSQVLVVRQLRTVAIIPLFEARLFANQIDNDSGRSVDLSTRGQISSQLHLGPLAQALRWGIANGELDT